MVHQIRGKKELKMSNRNEKFNGWTNWETWNFNLWYGDMLQDTVSEYASEENRSLEYHEVYNIVNGFVDQLLEDMTLEAGFLSDIIGHGIQALNQYEITEHILNSLLD
jgi:hypothetical protein